MSAYATMAARASEVVLSQELANANPLTRDEAHRLNDYVRRAERGEPFAPEEVENYNATVNPPVLQETLPCSRTL